MSGAGRRLQLAKCIDIVRKQDPNHYLCSTLLSPKYRATSFILHALNCELDQIVNKTTKAHLAALKFKWWTDAVNKVCNDADKVPPHPVASSLPDIVKDSRTCKYFLTKLVKGKLERKVEGEVERKVEVRLEGKLEGKGKGKLEGKLEPSQWAPHPV